MTLPFQIIIASLLLFMATAPFVWSVIFLRGGDRAKHSLGAKVADLFYGSLAPSSLVCFLLFFQFAFVVVGDWWWTQEGANVSLFLVKLRFLVFLCLSLGALVFSWKRNRFFAWGLALGIVLGILTNLWLLFRFFN